MRFHFVKAPKLLFLFLNLLLDICLLSLGNGFILAAFFLPILNIVLIPYIFKHENNRRKAILTICLLPIFCTTQLLYGYMFCDAGGIAFMWLLTAVCTSIPLLASVLTYVIKKSILIYTDLGLLLTSGTVSFVLKQAGISQIPSLFDFTCMVCVAGLLTLLLIRQKTIPCFAKPRMTGDASSS